MIEIVPGRWIRAGAVLVVQRYDEDEEDKTSVLLSSGDWLVLDCTVAQAMGALVHTVAGANHLNPFRTI